MLLSRSAGNAVSAQELMNGLLLLDQTGGIGLCLVSLIVNQVCLLYLLAFVLRLR